MKPVKHVVIVGGGTAGWLAAAALGKIYQHQVQVTLIESDAIPTVGVGEATIPTMQAFHKLLGIDEREMMRETHATFKLGINFRHWGRIGEDYIHAFGQVGQLFWGGEFQHFWRRGKDLGIHHPYGDYCLEQVAARSDRFAITESPALNYAFHMDAGLYAKYLRRFSESYGVIRQEGEVTAIQKNAHTGFIETVTLARGEIIQGDLFIDCSGFKALLIEGALETGYDNWQHWLPCDSALAVQTDKLDKTHSYTKATAHSAGWQWEIPLQNRIGNGLVYSSRFTDDDWARSTLIAHLPAAMRMEPKKINFITGRRKQAWNKNCIAMGLASGFLEPLESTSIHMVTSALVRLLRLFPLQGIRDIAVAEFNRQAREEAESIRDFIILHYHATERTDSEFWNYVRTMQVPDSLQHRLTLFKETGMIFLNGEELFRHNGWSQVMLGQGIIPAQFQAAVAHMPDSDFKQYLAGFRQHIAQGAEMLPSHDDFIARYCAMDSTVLV